MSKRTQLWIALGALGVVIVLLVILFIAVVFRPDQQGESLDAVAPPTAWEPEAATPSSPWANRQDLALQMVWERPSRAGDASEGRMTLRQMVETDLLQRTFPDLHWSRLERVGWRAFQQEESVYEVQFVLRDVGVEFGPSWIVQTDPAGLQPPGSGGVVAANVFAEVIEGGASEALTRYIGREAEVVEALTNHQFEQGARLASAILVYFKSRRRVTSREVIGWTVVPERIVPDELTLYRAFFQWQEEGRAYFAHWEINLDTRQFRGTNLLSSEIMALGDTINADELEQIRPRMLDETTPSASQRRAFQALRTIVDNERLIEAVAALLWHRSRHGTEIEYSRWNAQPVESADGVYDVSYEYLENGESSLVTWRVDVVNTRVTPMDEIAHLAYIGLNYVPVPPEPEEGDDG